MSAVATAEERKYPRTVHLAFSPCVFSDDLQQTNSSVFEGEEVVITEKLDGGNCCIDVMDKKVFARTHSHPTAHPSFGPVKALAQTLFWDPNFPTGIKLFGECMFGIHSIEYDNLQSFFYLFGVLENDSIWWSWEKTEALAQKYNLALPPVVFRGSTTISEIKMLMDDRINQPSGLGLGQVKPEGFVIRKTKAFPSSEFLGSIAKYVRKNHLQTDTNWKTTWRKASLNS